MPDRADLTKVPLCLHPLAKTPWDVEFLANPTFSTWLQAHLGAHPLPAEEPLVNYVRARLPPTSLKYAPSANDLPTPAPTPSASSASPSPTPPAAANPTSPSAMSFETSFDDVLDMSSYAADEPSGLDGFVDDAQFRAPSPVGPLYQALSPPRSASGRTMSPFSHYPGAIAPFTQAPPAFFSRTASPAFAASGALADPTVASSSLAPTADLIHRGRASSQAGSPAAQVTPWNGYFSAGAGAGVAGQVAAVPPGSLFNPAPSAGEASGPTMTITPSVISAPRLPSRSMSASPEAVRPARPTASAPAKKPVAATSTSSKSRRSASPAAPKRAPAAVSSYSSEHWTSFAPKVRAHLDPKRLQRTPVASAQFLVRNLHELFTYADRTSSSSPWGDGSDVPPEGRAEILSALFSFARDDFWRAWLAEGASAAGTSGGKGKEKEGAPAAAKSDGLELLQCWLEGASQRVTMSSRDKEAAKARPDTKERKKKELEATTLVLVLQVLAKLPLTYDHLLAYTAVPKRAKRISERAPEGAVKAAATQLVVKWGKLQAAARAGPSTAATAAGAAAKRKADETGGLAKKAKTATPTSTTTVKKPVAQPNPLAKALPSFKKAPATSAPPAAGRSALDAALAQLNARKTAPPPPPPPPVVPTSVAQSTAGATPRKGTGKRGGTAGNGGVRGEKMRVRWAPESELEKVKLIEKAIYADEDGVGGATVTAEGESLDESLHLMQEQEGLSLAMHFEEEIAEEIDWYPPVDVVIPDTEDFAPLRDPKQTTEPELFPDTAPMEVDGASVAPPDSPAEPPAAELEAPITPDDEIKRIPLHSELKNDPEVIQTIEDAQLSRPPAGGFASNDQISALLSQLSANGLVDALALTAPAPLETPVAPPVGAGPPSGGAQVQPPPAQISAEALEALRNYPPEQVAAIVQSQPGMAGLNLAVLGIAPPPLPPVAVQPSTGFDTPPPHGAYVPPGFAAQPYNGYVPPSLQQHAPPPPVAWGAPAADPYNGYQPPPPSGGYGAHAGAAVTALPPAAPRGFQGKKNMPCKFFRSRGRCDWGDQCRFSHE
ncbi:hypothetical protein JCM3770_000356 [Rhodotorula araucariae]